MSQNQTDPTVACTMSDDRAKERVAQVMRDLLPKYEQTDEIEDGYTLQFDGVDQTIRALADFVADELICCEFADYQITVSPPYEQTNLSITGPDGTKELFGPGLIDRLESQKEGIMAE